MLEHKAEVNPENMVERMKGILQVMQPRLLNVADSIYEPLKTVLEGTMVLTYQLYLHQRCTLRLDRHLWWVR